VEGNAGTKAVQVQVPVNLPAPSGPVVTVPQGRSPARLREFDEGAQVGPRRLLPRDRREGGPAVLHEALDRELLADDLVSTRTVSWAG